jgi:hypothetical protein
MITLTNKIRAELLRMAVRQRMLADDMRQADMHAHAADSIRSAEQMERDAGYHWRTAQNITGNEVRLTKGSAR